MNLEPRDLAGNVSEAQLRKNHSIQHLRNLGLPVLECLPLIETVADSLRRNLHEVSVRALALATVAVKAEGDGFEDPDTVGSFISQLVKDFELGSAFTPLEQAFLDSSKPTEHSRVQFTWRYECYWTLLWALGFVPEMGEPSSMCDPATAMRIMREHGRRSFLETASLRAQSEILDEADLIYRYHWAVVNARLRGETVEGVDSGVVFERHYALNWLIGYQGQDWDNISTDT